MPHRTGQFEWIGKLVRVCLGATVALLSLALIATVAAVVIKMPDLGNWQVAAPWVLTIVAELTGLLWVFVFYGLVKIIVANEAGVNRAAWRLDRLETLMADQAASSKKLTDLASLSDQAKSLIYREREIDAIREVIHHDLMQQDYRTAELLIGALEERLGYGDEAARLREEVAASRKTTLAEKVDAAVKRIQDTIDAKDWPRASREAQRMARVFPKNAKIAALPERVETAYVAHKRQLLQAYGEAVRKKDIDRGIGLLKELDRYLTLQEAAALEDSARGVFKAKLHSLGVEFAICVTDKRWAEAVAIGTKIVRDYPNTRIANEVREKMGHLQTRAAPMAENAQSPERPTMPGNTTVQQ